jgi:5-methylcytosine-specific restriction endonuclease McrA
VPGSFCVVCRWRIPRGSRCSKHAVRSPSNRAWHQPGAARLREKVLQRDGGCVLCAADEHLTVHHIVSVADGGTNDLSNLVVLCERHHDLVHRGVIDLAQPVP